MREKNLAPGQKRARRVGLKPVTERWCHGRRWGAAPRFFLICFAGEFRETANRAGRARFVCCDTECRNVRSVTQNEDRTLQPRETPLTSSRSPSDGEGWPRGRVRGVSLSTFFLRTVLSPNRCRCWRGLDVPILGAQAEAGPTFFLGGWGS